MMASDRRIRILHVLEATAGGTRRHLRELVSSLPASHFQSSIACAVLRDPSFEDDIADYRARGVAVHVVHMTRAPHLYRDVAACIQLRRIVRSTRCHVLHLHSAKAGLLGRVASLGMHCPVIYAPHAFSFLEPSFWGKLAGIVERTLAPKTTTLWAVSRAEAALATSRGGYPARAIRVIPNTIELDVSVAVPMRSGETSGGTRRRFGFLGELRPQKQPLLFLKGVQAMGQPSLAHFFMPNVGPLLGAARAFVERHGLGDRVTFVDTKRSLDPLYRQIDVGVLPSAYEGMPYALLDAMARGQPVIGSDIPAFTDTIGRVDERLIAKFDDPAALAATMAIWARLPDRELRRAGATARALVAAEYRRRDWIGPIAELYTEVARGTHAELDWANGDGTADSAGLCSPARSAKPARWIHDLV